MKPLFLATIVFFIVASCKKDENNSPDPEEQNLASIFIDPISNISGDIAYSGGDIVDNGGSPIDLKGLCWSTSPNPTIDDQRTNKGSGDEDFTAEIFPIEFNTIYYVRAFATNGVGTAYSDEISFTSTNECTMNIFDGDVVLTSQSEINAFGLNNYCKITGDLVIRQPQNTTTDLITDLSPLENLRYIGRLWVDDTTELEDLDGLHHLSFIFDSININDNVLLANIDALGAVDSAMTSIAIRRNNSLINVDGLSGITTLIQPTGYSNPPHVYISSNPALTNIDGLGGLVNVTDDTGIALSNVPLITQVSGLSGLSGTLGNLTLVNMPGLINLEGLENIRTVGGILDIFQCDQLSTLEGLNGLNTVSGEFKVLFNDGLNNLEGLSNLEFVKFFWIKDNGLSDFCALQNLFNAGGVEDFLVEGNNYNPSEQDIIDGNCSL